MQIYYKIVSKKIENSVIYYYAYKFVQKSLLVWRLVIVFSSSSSVATLLNKIYSIDVFYHCSMLVGGYFLRCYYNLRFFYPHLLLGGKYTKWCAFKSFSKNLANLKVL